MADPNAIIELRAKLGWGIGFLGAGALLAVLSLLIGSWVTVFSGSAIALLGLSYLTRPVATVSANEVHVYNALGMAMKKIPYSKRSDLKADKKLVVNSGGKQKKTGMRSWLINAQHWSELQDFSRS